jgi:predicted ArsR family transcriptional regulator
MLIGDELEPLAEELSQRWRELGRTLTSRRMLASLQAGGPSPLTPTKLYALDVLAESGELRIGELAERVGLDETSATRMVDRLESGRDRRAAEQGRGPARDDRPSHPCRRRARGQDQRAAPTLLL